MCGVDVTGGIEVALDTLNEKVCNINLMVCFADIDNSKLQQLECSRHCLSFFF